mmetsp:Transcript_39273/g.57780  ORF Transcript_39273/g.57780 Transcript_39273/m.57780 type:complete len:87 (+) Transcript_39273:944-1204(+)
MYGQSIWKRERDQECMRARVRKSEQACASEGDRATTRAKARTVKNIARAREIEGEDEVEGEGERKAREKEKTIERGREAEREARGG